jgi:thymidylate kinase
MSNLAYYEVISQSYSEWTERALSIFTPQIHVYLDNLYKDAELRAKKDAKKEHIYGLFQR